MIDLYLGYTLFEYAFMILWTVSTIGLVVAYVKLEDLKEQRDYYKYLSKMIVDKERQNVKKYR